MNTSVYYYSTIALCVLLNELSTSFGVQACAAMVGLGLAGGMVIFEKLGSYEH